MTDTSTAGATPTPPTFIHENLLGNMAEFLTSHLKAGVVSMEDPVDGTPGAFIETANGELEVLDRSMFDSYRTNPTRRQGTATLLDLASFIALTNRFKDPDSAVFADNDRARPRVTAVLDYNESIETRVAAATDENGQLDIAKIGRPPQPRFGSHRATYAFPLSDEWKAWAAANGKGNAMGMEAMAAFLEDRIIDVAFPTTVEFGPETQRFISHLGGNELVADPAQLLELSRNFHVHEASTVRQGTNISSGEGVIQLESEHLNASGEKLVVPKMFVIVIPVFKGETAYPIIARLRYRAASGSKPVFWYELWRSDKVFDIAFDGALDRVRSETGLPVLLGSPEA